MYKRYINSIIIIIIIIIIIRCLSKNISLAESFQLPESLLSTERQLWRTENRRHGQLGLMTWEIAHMTYSPRAS